YLIRPAQVKGPGIVGKVINDIVAAKTGRAVRWSFGKLQVQKTQGKAGLPDRIPDGENRKVMALLYGERTFGALQIHGNVLEKFQLPQGHFHAPAALRAGQAVDAQLAAGKLAEGRLRHKAKQQDKSTYANKTPDHLCILRYG